MTKIKLDEPILKDDYPVYAGYAYVVDGKPLISDVSGSVATLRNYYSASEVRRCDIFGRKVMWEQNNAD